MRNENDPGPLLSINVIRLLRREGGTADTIAGALGVDTLDVLACEREAERAEYLEAYRLRYGCG